MKKLALLLLVLLAVCHAKRRFDSYKVLKITPHDAKDIEKLRQIEDLCDVWRMSHQVGRAAHVMVDAAQELICNAMFKDVTVLHENVQKLIDREDAELARRKSFVAGEEIALDQYNKFSEIDAWIQQLVQKNPKVLSLITLGGTYDKNTLHAIKFSTGGTGKPTFWLDGCIHAREWIASATAVWVINELVTNMDKYMHYLNNINIVVVPVFNVDGYEWTWTNDRLWRKTRSKHLGGICYGVDPNRNWPYEWDDAGASNNPCSEIYAGPSAASEDIVKDAMAYLQNKENNVTAYMNMHSYSQMWFYPYAYAPHTYPPNVDQLRKVSQEAVAAIEAVHGTHYEMGSPADILYSASGSTFDWTAHIGIPLSFGMELRPDDNSPYGFQLPANQIIPCAEETWAGLQKILDAMM